MATVAILKRENNDLKEQIATIVEELAILKELIQEQSVGTMLTSEETVHSLDFLGKEYNDLCHFRTKASKELQHLSTKLAEVTVKVNAIGNAIDEFHKYSFQLHWPAGKWAWEPRIDMI